MLHGTLVGSSSGLRLVSGLVVSALLVWAEVQAASALALHPKNPHYFLFRGKPTVLIGSGEHYGAVLNLDFDYVKYLEAFQRDGMNVTRTFSGAYVEPATAFNIARNTLAPATNRFICPWGRSSTPGYPMGGNKFDLTQWDNAYFARLKDFVAQAGRRGVVVELNLFCPFYDESQWALSPQNAANNVNGLGQVARTNVYTLDQNGGLLAVHEALVRKIVTELRSFDNVYYEICNEPYFGGVTLEWQARVAEVIAQTEKGLRCQHLISQNIANDKAKVAHPHPAVSIFNFHYATPPDTVPMNYGLNKVIGDNETGFRGTNNTPYRFEAWEFILAGGGLFNHLDYSFVAGQEDGTYVYPASQPGGGNPVLRQQFRILRDFIQGFDLTQLRPANELIVGAVLPGTRARAMAEPGKACAVYVCRPALAKGQAASQTTAAAAAAPALILQVRLDPGRYRVEWLNPQTGQIDKHETLEHPAGVARLTAPPWTEDVAVRILSTKQGLNRPLPRPAPTSPKVNPPGQRRS